MTPDFYRKNLLEIKKTTSLSMIKSFHYEEQSICRKIYLAQIHQSFTNYLVNTFSLQQKQYIISFGSYLESTSNLISTFS